ncbi:putative glucose-6-phosphate 1-epimerase isoform X2 [Dendrobium catenatum]|uniref:putative glucose-6-phosphate 1-epimerase isoform X2 n=1 Tax=Dendrobium catenatum TaxID=906689 RepID=UPI00109F17AC|nr:putative glucose-6-phosphate 1-epimerase isoform X2 [Dendrobium catenatum]
MGKSAAVWDQRSELEIARDWNGIEQVVLRVPRGASAKVSLHGGQVISWKNERGEELLFTSSKAIFKPPKAMRGGIPICFPQFGNCGSLEQHGFARNKVWSIDDDPPTLHSNDSNGKVFVDLLLKPMEDDLKCWPHCEVRVEGLETLDYLDNLCQRERFTEQGDAITFESEVDRIYLGTPNVVAVLDHEKKRTFVIRKEGLPDMVVWNPWEKKSKSMLDLGDDEYKQMLCVDAAAIERPITLKTGEEWTGRLEISAVPSSYCSDHFDQLLQGVM